MDKKELNRRINARGREIYGLVSQATPSFFNKKWWAGKVIDWSMRNDRFKVQLFRFVDVLPCLTTDESLQRHVKEYFVSNGAELPAALTWGIKGLSHGGQLTAKILATSVRSNIEKMAQEFIIGDTIESATKTLRKLREQGFAFTIDILGEATVSEDEARQYQNRYRTLLDHLGREQERWESLNDGGTALDWGHTPKLNVSIKLSSLYSQARPADFEGSVTAIHDRLVPILSKVIEAGAFLCIDMESFRFKDITLAVYKRLRSTPAFRHYAHLGIVLQAYLRETDQDLANLIAWAEKRSLPISIRLTKGAYWDYETIVAKQNGWQIPVYTNKAETDASFERNAQSILENHHICHLACASHNIRSIASVIETARALDVPEDRYEFQMLYGMAEPVRKTLLEVAKRVRLYTPYGALIPGMAYLVRRLLENTSNESFIRQVFVEKAALERLLQDPAESLSKDTAKPDSESLSPPRGELRRFANEPVADFSSSKARSSFPKAIAEVRRSIGITYPLLIGGKKINTAETMASVNPANPSEVIGYVCLADREHIDQALAEAGQAFSGWKDRPAEERAGYLYKAAEIARERMYELAAWEILEVGKQWDQAYADVAEAIDFLEYYGREMERLAAPRQMGGYSGERNLYCYRPKGIAAVIAPWNFPLAISCGMCAAALVCGNCVIYKPSGLSPVIGYALAEIFREAGLPRGVFNFVPGKGGVIGDYLVERPGINIIAFTGSREVGLRIIERTAKVQPGQVHVKKVIAEMGGKNAIIIDDDADLDEVVVHVLTSSFGYQGQKCSACSRAIVLEGVYDRFIGRLLEAAKSLKIGPAEDPANYLGPVIDQSAQDRIQSYIEIGKHEGVLLLSREVPDEGYYVPLCIFAEIRPNHRLAREEIFGPVLSVMKARSFDEAIQWANSTEYALTGAVFSRSPAHLEYACRQFEVGNLYLNRGCTGALVERQPFGGFKMSGIGSKAGGPDYLLQFMDPRSVSENTMRRGFAPINH